MTFYISFLTNLWKKVGHKIMTENMLLFFGLWYNSSIHHFRTGKCNGVAIWMDWEFGSDSYVSCGPIKPVNPGNYITWDTYSKQGVYFFKEPLQASTITYDITFSPKSGKFIFDFKIKSWLNVRFFYWLNLGSVGTHVKWWLGQPSRIYQYPIQL